MTKARVPLPGDPGASAVQFGQAANQRESKACTAGLAIVAIVHLGERLEDAIDALIRYAGSIVRDDQLEVAGRIAFCRDIDATAVLSELDGVRHQIDDNLLQRAFVGVKDRGAIIHRNREHLISLARLHADEFQRALERAAGFDHMRLDLHAAGFDFGNVEEIVDRMSASIASSSRSPRWTIATIARPAVQALDSRWFAA